MLKRLFKKRKKEEGPEIISADDWIREYEEVHEKHVNEMLEDLSHDINRNAQRLNEKSRLLLNAKPEDKDINQRVLNLIENNLIKYVRKVKVLALDALIQEKLKPEKAAMIAKQFSHTLVEFYSTTNKTYFFLKDYYYPDIREIIRFVRSIERDYKKLPESAETEKRKKFETLREEIKKYKTKIILEKRKKEDIDFAKKDLVEIEEKLNSVMNKKEILLRSEDYSRHKNIYEQKERLASRLLRKKEELIGLINTIKKLLMIYRKQDVHEKLINKYLADPINSAMSDFSFSFEGAIKGLDKSLRSGKVAVDKRKANQIKIAMSKMLQKGFLDRWTSEYRNIEHMKQDIERQLNKNKTMMDILELDYKIGHANDKVGNRNEIIKEAEEQISILNTAETKKALEADLKEFAGKMVKLI
ncbi:hypothetical protein GOV08_05055 [Candidatus Woesearchaeota archaeon]|nr:hypothetical protein [Candidatus Woesearchaeota archaeon]